MKLSNRLISMLLALILLVSLLASCNPTSSGDDTSAEDTSTDDTTGTVEQDVREIFDLVAQGKSNVTIRRPAELSSTDTAVSSAVSIRSQIELTTGVKVDIKDDWKKPTDEYDNEAIEILVGPTAYPQTAEAIKDLTYGDYTIKAVGNKIVIFGFTDDAMSYAANQFNKLVRNLAVKDEGAETSSLSIPVTELQLTATRDKSLALLPFYEGGTFSSTYDPGNDCSELILDDATPENYAAYIAKLEAAGYTKYTDNDINGNLFTTLYNSDYTLNVGFYDYSDECRIIVEPFSDSTLIGLESDNVYTPVTTSQITMLGCEYGSSGSYTGNGLSLLFRLADGSFVIVDGAHSTNAATWANNLINAMREQSKDYAKNDSEITISAWIISHAHGDHSGMLTKQYALFKKFNVERFIVNFMSDDERNKSMTNSSTSGNWSNGEGGGWTGVIAAANALNAEICVAHVGQRYYIGDTVFEILYTIESFGPTITNAFNTTSLLVRAITTDSTGRTTTTMVTGDITGPALAICNSMYGKNMKSDIVQVSHHGYSTWGNNAATATAYIYMAPEIVLWPQGLHAYPSYVNKDYNVTLHNASNPNYKETYVAGWNNTRYIVPLPFTYGVDQITEILTKE